MPAKTKKQQRFMGMVYRCKKTGECPSSAVKKVADNIKTKDAKELASTKHNRLPERTNTMKKITNPSFLDFLSERNMDVESQMSDDAREQYLSLSPKSQAMVRHKISQMPDAGPEEIDDMVYQEYEKDSGGLMGGNYDDMDDEFGDDDMDDDMSRDLGDDDIDISLGDDDMDDDMGRDLDDDDMDDDMSRDLGDDDMDDDMGRNGEF